MSTESQPQTNKHGLSKKDYSGSPSTLCTGCGHDMISNHIITACYQSGIHPFQLAKMSGIGCSSKIPAYFISKSFSFNSMHGRMAPVTTGAKVCNKDLTMLGISGDGDTASIGMGGFAHLLRRNLPMCYIVANNGVYGLTKGQFSATADKGAKLKTGANNPFETIDLCTLALELGCTFVARSFSGDAKQLVPLIEAALRHKGTAFIDVFSPCITFNNHDGSTKSYNYIKSHDIVLQELGFYAPQEEIIVDYSEGSKELVELPDGSKILLNKIDSRLHDVKNRLEAARVLTESRMKGEILTGLFYIDESEANLVETLNLCEKPLARLTEEELRPSEAQFTKVMSRFT
jgi:2-oxoglutarate ferredoxin oxidoreductase subunit beta